MFDLAGWAANAVGGSMILALPTAFLAGLVSFLSPCVVPLLPGYLSYATGLGAAQITTGQPRRGRMLAGTSLFVLGFSVVFVAAGVLAGSVGRALFAYRPVLNVVAGVVSVVLGLSFAGVTRWGRRDFRLNRSPVGGVAAAPLLGVVFGLGWTPCIGPTLGVVLNMALNEGSVARGAFLASVYALGLGAPFVVAGQAYQRLTATLGLFRRHQVALMRLGGAMMVCLGVLLLTGLWDGLIAVLRQWTLRFGSLL